MKKNTARKGKPWYSLNTMMQWEHLVFRVKVSRWSHRGGQTSNNMPSIIWFSGIKSVTTSWHYLSETLLEITSIQYILTLSTWTISRSGITMLRTDAVFSLSKHRKLQHKSIVVDNHVSTTKGFFHDSYLLKKDYLMKQIPGLYTKVLTQVVM